MGKRSVIIGLLFLTGIAAALENAYYGDDFLQTFWGARGAAMGGAVGADIGNAASTYYNPSGLGEIAQKEVLIQHAAQFASKIQYDLIAGALPLGNGVGLGIGLWRSSIDNIMDTRSLLLDDEGTPIYDPGQIGMLSAVDYALFAGLGKSLSKHLLLGGTAKMYYRDLGIATGYGMACDAGILWKARRNISFGVNVRNFTTAYTTWQTGNNETAYPSADVTFAYKRAVPYFYGTLSFTGRLGSLLPFEGMNTRETEIPDKAYLFEDPSKALENAQGGAEYTLKNILSLRIGIHPVYRFTAGAGIEAQATAVKNPVLSQWMRRFSISAISLDYAFLQHPELSQSNFLSLRIVY